MKRVARFFGKGHGWSQVGRATLAKCPTDSKTLPLPSFLYRVRDPTGAILDNPRPVERRSNQVQ